MLDDLRVATKNQDDWTRFESLLSELSRNATEHNIEACESNATQAFCIAAKTGSPMMMATVNLQLALAYLLVHRFNPALKEFRKATVKARASKVKDSSLSAKLEVQALSGEGAVFFAMEKYAVAKEVYKEAAEIADRAGLYLSAMDGWFMASVCYEILGRFGDAYCCCESALLEGEKMPKVERHKESFAQVGDSLLRITDQLKTDGITELSVQMFRSKEDVDQRLAELIGRNWREYVPRKVRERT